jgi:hypothetical protein
VKVRFVLLLLVATFVASHSVTIAHDIPVDVTVQAFLKPAGRQLFLLVRVPLKAILDVDFPRRGPGFLDLQRIDPSLQAAARLRIVDQIELFEDNMLLASPGIVEARVSLPSDRSFESWEQALAHVEGARLPADTELYWEQGMLDVLLDYQIRSDQSQFAIHPKFAKLGISVVTVLRFIAPSGVIRAFDLRDDPGLVRIDPRWHQAALNFVRLGFFHILDGIDHLLFLFCLVIPFRRLASLIAIVTSFTIAHSITLIASAYNYAPGALWFPPLVESLIAMSIVYMALENIVGGNLRRRWLITFGFGLIHGFGFSFALHETLQFAGSHLVTSLLAFNVGVELGQVLVLVILVPILAVLFRHVVAERIGTIILSALVAHTGWHWMVERLQLLSQFPWPDLDAATLASAMRWLMVVLILGTTLWAVSGIVGRRIEQGLAKKTVARAEE